VGLRARKFQTKSTIESTKENYHEENYHQSHHRGSDVVPHGWRVVRHPAEQLLQGRRLLPKRLRVLPERLLLLPPQQIAA